MIVLSPLVFVLVCAALARIIAVVARERSTWRAVVIGLAWPGLWAAPSALVQAALIGEDGFENPLFLAIGWLIGVGGHSVTLLFEANVGDRQSTLADNFDLYLVFWAIQLALLFLLGMLRFRATGRLRDKWMLLLGVVVAVNALWNVSWPWWGT